MSSVRRTSKAVLLSGAVLLTTAAASSPAFAWPFAPKEAPKVEAAPAPPPPPSVSMSAEALSDAAAFRAYTKHAELLNAAFTSGAGVEQSLAVGSAYEPHQLARGSIAYAALLALQDRTFVEGVRTYAIDPTQRRQVAAHLAADPRYVIAFPGAASAAGLIVATMGVESSRITDVAARIKQSAYSVQHSAWSKTKVIDPVGRLAQTKALSAAIMNGEAGDVDQLKLAMNGGADATAAQVLAVHGQSIPGPYAPVVERGLALAALAALGEAGDENAAAVQAVETEPTDGACLNLAKLNLYQCLAVAVPWYEDIFCLGEHALGETAQCISNEAASKAQIQQAETPPPGAIMVPTAATAVSLPVSANIPLASASLPGHR
ncbi:hypothetical protein [Caulobacter sp. S45]|uniref:hypothetical protein n=1 Tax=Caulobacter sp. S45 TaxID=1641861 RepID=UPI0015776C24|nr:hypothetical protein [Caulobacter sp. S45]